MMSGCGGCQGSAVDDEREVEAPRMAALPPDGKVVVLTQNAANKVKEFMRLEKKEQHGLRVLVAPGGCAGYQYGLDFEEKSKPDDIVSEQHGVKVFINPESAGLLVGTEIDYVEGLQGSGFKLNNPNAKQQCGCGNSFG